MPFFLKYYKLDDQSKSHDEILAEFTSLSANHRLSLKRMAYLQLKQQGVIDIDLDALYQHLVEIYKTTHYNWPK